MSRAPSGRGSAAAITIACALALLFAVSDGASAPSPQEPPAAERRPGRRVRVSVVPAGARLWIDGTETSWFGRTLTLGVGSHRVRAEVPGSRCCRPWSGVVRVAPATRLDEPQRLVIPLEILPAKVVLVDAPPDAELRCKGLALSSRLGQLVRVRLHEPEWSGFCELRSGGLSETRRVRLVAGEVNAIPWAE